MNALVMLTILVFASYYVYETEIKTKQKGV